MTRDDILRDYKPNKYGRISAPGKFEGEMLYVPHFYGQEPATQDTGLLTYKVTEEDAKAFPELSGKKEVWLAEDDQGFIYEVPAV
jgi:hypothetical protein